MVRRVQARIVAGRPVGHQAWRAPPQGRGSAARGRSAPARTTRVASAVGNVGRWSGSTAVRDSRAAASVLLRGVALRSPRSTHEASDPRSRSHPRIARSWGSRTDSSSKGSWCRCVLTTCRARPSCATSIRWATRPPGPGSSRTSWAATGTRVSRDTASALASPHLGARCTAYPPRASASSSSCSIGSATSCSAITSASASASAATTRGSRSGHRSRSCRRFRVSRRTRRP